MTKTGYYILILSCFSIALIITCGCIEDGPDLPTIIHDQVDGTAMVARTGSTYFSVYDDEGWHELIIKGVNIGTSLPGRWYTQFPADRDLYRQWLEDIANMNANTIRLYTLLDPAFYAVLHEYNSDPRHEKIWLIQEIWPHDDVPNLNFYDHDYQETYKKEICLVIDAMHGNADIAARPYRAYGRYSVDVSPYLLGVLLGRELEPDEVEATNNANPNITGFSGDYVETTATATATESWLAEMCNHTMQYSQETYGWQYPVGFVSWPTLDPLVHPTEWEADGTPGYNDREIVNPNIFTAGKQSHAGFFGAYHIYPNYPDFMNNEPEFADYSDREGQFRYRGYLDHFMAIHPDYPAIVAEFGISTSLNTAHLSPDGLHHGGLNEIDQGEMTIRMMRSIIDLNYAGGIIFEWSDEWAKKTWNTEPFMIPWERQVLWQNAMCPEQNYGILAVEPEEIAYDELLSTWHQSTEYYTSHGYNNHFGKIKSIKAGADEAYLYIALSLEEDFTDDLLQNKKTGTGLMVGIDIDKTIPGEHYLPIEQLPRLPSGVQFLLHINSEKDSQLLSIPTYDRSSLNFNPQKSETSDFNQIITLVNRERITAEGEIIPAQYANESKLFYGNFRSSSDDYSSLSHWYICHSSQSLIVRLPWMLLNVSDPSSHLIIFDDSDYLEPPGRDVIDTKTTEGFTFYVATYYGLYDFQSPLSLDSLIDFQPRNDTNFKASISPYLWEGWEEPTYQLRHKESYYIIADYFENLQNPSGRR